MRLPLHATHQALGASFHREGDWELPAGYGETRAEYDAARTAAALADLGHFGKLVFKGPDRHAFLHGLLTNDIQNLKPGEGLPTLVLTPKGLLVADFVLYNRGGDLVAVCRPQAKPGILQALSKSIRLSETLIEDQSAALGAFYLTGPKAARVLETLSGPIAWTEYACSSMVWRGAWIELLSYPAMGPQGRLLLFPAERSLELWDSLVQAGRAGLRPAGCEALEILRVEAGVPLLGMDMDSATLPLEAGLESSISFTKGCYMGQETTARIKSVGHVNRALAGLRLGFRPKPGSSVLSGGKAAGKITSSVDSPRLGAALALAMLRVEHSRPGARLEVSMETHSETAEVVRLPL